MCGRYALTVEPDSLYGSFEAEPDELAGGVAGLYGGDPARPRYNIAPTLTVPVVRLNPRVPTADAAREIEPMRWGLVPSWAKDVAVGNKMFNARVESLTTKAAFRAALAKRRCLIPATGYFEWRALGGQVTGASGRASKPAKQAYYLTPADGSIMAFAGLWEYWKSAEGEPLVSMTIVTSESVGDVRAIHDRMPLILPASEWSDWLDPRTDPTPMLEAPSPALVAALELRPVGPRVGNVRFDDAELLERVEPPLALLPHA